MTAAIVAAADSSTLDGVLTDDGLEHSISPEIKTMTRSIENDLITFEKFLEELMTKKDVLAGFNNCLDSSSDRMKAEANKKEDEILEEYFIECKEEIQKALLEFEQEERQQHEIEFEQVNNIVVEEKSSEGKSSDSVLSDCDDSGRELGIEDLLVPSQALVRGFLACRRHRLQSLIRQYFNYKQQGKLDLNNGKNSEDDDDIEEEGVSIGEEDDDDDDDTVDEGTPIGEGDLIVPFQALVRGYLVRRC